MNNRPLQRFLKYIWTIPIILSMLVGLIGFALPVGATPSVLSQFTTTDTYYYGNSAIYYQGQVITAGDNWTISSFQFLALSYLPSGSQSFILNIYQCDSSGNPLVANHLFNTTQSFTLTSNVAAYQSFTIPDVNLVSGVKYCFAINSVDTSGSVGYRGGDGAGKVGTSNGGSTWTSPSASYELDYVLSGSVTPITGAITLSPSVSELNQGVLDFNTDIVSYNSNSYINLAIEYGTTNVYGSKSDAIHCVPGHGGTPLSPSDVFTIEIPGLLPNTEYYYIYDITDSTGAKTQSNSGTYTTAAANTIPGFNVPGKPVISTTYTSLEVSLEVNEEQINYWVDDFGYSSSGVANNSLVLDLQYGRTDACNIDTGTNTTITPSTSVAPFYNSSATLSNLDQNTVYYYRFKITEPSGRIDYTAAEWFRTSSSNPVLFNLVTVETGSGTTAGGQGNGVGETLTGTLTSMGNAANVEVGFEVWLTAGVPYDIIVQNMTDTGAFSQYINGLAPTTTYNFVAFATGDDGNGRQVGSAVPFTTGSGTAPTIPLPFGGNPAVLEAVSSVANGQTSEILKGNLTSLGAGNTSVQVGFVYWTANNPHKYFTVGSMSITGAFSATITRLTAGTLYHWEAYSPSPIEAYSANGFTFTTAAIVSTTPGGQGGVIVDKANEWLSEHGLNKNYWWIFVFVLMLAPWFFKPIREHAFIGIIIDFVALGAGIAILLDPWMVALEAIPCGFIIWMILRGKGG